MFILDGREPRWESSSCIPQYHWSVFDLLQGASADLILSEWRECIDEYVFHQRSCFHQIDIIDYPAELSHLHGLVHHIVYFRQRARCICSGEYVMVSDSFTECVILEVKSIGVLKPGQMTPAYLFAGGLRSCMAVVLWLENIRARKLASH